MMHILYNDVIAYQTGGLSLHIKLEILKMYTSEIT